MEKREYIKNEDGTITVNIIQYTLETEIADKEAKLLEIYNEIQKLKEQL